MSHTKKKKKKRKLFTNFLFFYQRGVSLTRYKNVPANTTNTQSILQKQIPDPTKFVRTAYFGLSDLSQGGFLFLR